MSIRVVRIIKAFRGTLELVDDLSDKGVGSAAQPGLQRVQGREVARRGVPANINRAGGIHGDGAAAYAVLGKILVSAATKVRRISQVAAVECQLGHKGIGS